MVEAKKVEEKVESTKGYTFACGGCGRQWTHKVKKTSGLCVICVGIRRANQAFINQGVVTKAELLDRLGKLLK